MVIRGHQLRTRRSARRDAPGMYSDVPAHQPRSGCALSAAISAGSLTNPSTSRRGGASQLVNGTSSAAATPAAAAAPAACRRFVSLRSVPSKLGSSLSPSKESSRNQATRGSVARAAVGFEAAVAWVGFEAAVAWADGMAATRPAARPLCDRSLFCKVCPVPNLEARSLRFRSRAGRPRSGPDLEGPVCMPRSGPDLEGPVCIPAGMRSLVVTLPRALLSVPPPSPSPSPSPSSMSPDATSPPP